MEINFFQKEKIIKSLYNLADQALWYLPMRRALSLAKYGPWYLSHMDDAVMAEFLMPPVIMPRGRLHMCPAKIPPVYMMIHNIKLNKDSIEKERFFVAK